mmetsp:Transcript_77626/g.231306  ORF Transcript_77626/g.231306 Transcript_77626/m.231306 type:complete len:180 (-) Transcript_77626:51-590(-)|eukprot:CAMPEP_0175267218 /NCGR_PEP_ID=MMETSP0093-20121207/43730_1 /TAXON_ID=311494 /ORGANISM="Alexandrium monilatum, Strain CCMP3105" /LENGTH=179 /DNA_ID=CAMNT_0016561837 /DNA_START=59 /DNA_END=598 /DNA_ORIENTATION=+
MAKGPDLPELEEKRVASLYSKTDILKVLADFFQDALPRVGYQEEHFWTNIRIVLCIVCCTFGCYAQFGTKFPQDRHILALCVVGYFLFSGILALVDYMVVNQSAICITIGGVPVFVDLNLPTFSEELTITLRSKERKVNHKTSIGKYFDTEGVLRQEHVFSDFNSLVDRYKGEKEKKNL